MWTKENLARLIYGILGLGFVLLIIDTVIVDLPVYLIVLGVCALVLGSSALVGISVRQIMNREDGGIRGNDIWTNKTVVRMIYGTLGLGFVLLIIDTVVVALPLYLIALGVCALVLGSSVIIGMSVRQMMNREDGGIRGNDIWTNETVVHAIYGIVGLGFVLFIIDTMVVDLPVYLMVLGLWALVSGGSAIIGESVRQTISREDGGIRGNGIRTNETVLRLIYIILGLGFVLLIINAMVVDLPVYLMVLGICALVLGGSAIIGESVRQIINRKDAG